MASVIEYRPTIPIPEGTHITPEKLLRLARVVVSRTGNLTSVIAVPGRTTTGEGMAHLEATLTQLEDPPERIALIGRRSSSVLSESVQVWLGWCASHAQVTSSDRDWTAGTEECLREEVDRWIPRPLAPAPRSWWQRERPQGSQGAGSVVFDLGLDGPRGAPQRSWMDHPALDAVRKIAPLVTVIGNLVRLVHSLLP